MHQYKLHCYLNKLTSPTTAETRNLTQSIGVNPGFFFSGCKWQKVPHQVISCTRAMRSIKSHKREEKKKGQEKRTRTISISAIGIFLKCFTYIPRSSFALVLARLNSNHSLINKYFFKVLSRLVS